MINSTIKITFQDGKVKSFDGWDIKVDGSFVVLNKETSPGAYLVTVYSANVIAIIESEVKNHE